MSYLHTPRLVFSGDFLSDVSTVNNDPAHYNNETFQKSFQELRTADDLNGWWNPEGGAVFDFQNCSIKQLTFADGSTASTVKECDLVGQLVKGAEGRTTGKMVDLDPQQQMVSQLWAVKLRILTTNDELILEGDITPVPFRDLQRRQTAGSKINGQPLGGTWTSTLTNISWGKTAGNYRFFKELRNTTQGNKLSINLNGFGYYYNQAKDGRFSLGRLLGAIGPWFKGEPETFAPCRRLYGIHNQSINGLQIYFGTTNFRFDKANDQVTLDFGSSFPVADALGTINFKRSLYLAVSKQPYTNSIHTNKVEINKEDFQTNYLSVGQVSHDTAKDWLLDTGGIVTITLKDQKAASSLGNNQLVLLTKNKRDNYILIARESIDGYLLRADNFVQRIDTDDTHIVKFFGYQWGSPIQHETIDISMQPATAVTPKGPKNPICEVPGNNYPVDGLTFPSTIQLTNGYAELPITGNKILNPRGYLDGQIYFLDYVLRGVGTDPAIGPFTNDMISIHLRSYFPVPESPVWDDIAETMTQFSNLYPIMSKYIVDLSDPQAVISKKEILKLAFSVDIKDSMHMPVTRDLSANKKETILKWLENPQIEGDHSAATKNELRSPDSGPAKKDQSLTIKQQQLKDAMRAKSGEFIDFNEIEELNF